MDESISGFERRGSWGDVVEHGERISRALRDVGAEEVHAETFEEWNEWRPKAHEDDRDVNEKTAEQASVDEGEGERAGVGPGDDVRTAGQKLAESYERIEEDRDAAVRGWAESIDHIARAADSVGRKALRAVEGTVYQRLMTRMAPYYFDNELVSANLTGATGNATFVFEVNVNDDDLKDAVSERLATYDEEIDRWHVDIEKDTSTAEAAEGVDPPVDDGDDADPTTN
ncbi:hypothetical protein BRD17_08730 [Halobacteriales archaeon SW_7_68_16]|nr:MAG: hypothetical protein BRD17_08730 [Halobacteriales archaeon SW_7_68_16]